MQEKLKSYLASDQVFYGFLLILVAFGSFALGRYSIVVPTPTGESRVVVERSTKVVEAPLMSSSAPVVVSELNNLYQAEVKTLVVASKSGTKYHLPTCPGAKQIKSTNLITFNSKQEAEAAGYTPASNCPGL